MFFQQFHLCFLSVKFYCAEYREKSPFRHRLHSAAGPQAPAELTVAIATTTDNYPAKDRYSNTASSTWCLCWRYVAPIVEWPSSCFFFAIRCEFQKEGIYRVCAISHHDDSRRWIINITCVAVRTCLKVWQLCSEMCESPHWCDLLQALICQQTFTPQVATCKYGLIINKRKKKKVTKWLHRAHSWHSVRQHSRTESSCWMRCYSHQRRLNWMDWLKLKKTNFNRTFFFFFTKVTSVCHFSLCWSGLGYVNIS